MKKLSRNLLYLSFHNSLLKVYKNKVVRREEIHIKLGRQFLVPKKLREVALKELESMKLIKEIDRNIFKIVEGDFNLEENQQKFYDACLS